MRVHESIYKQAGAVHGCALAKGSNDASATPRDQVAFDEANNNHQKYTTYGTSMRIGIDLGAATLTSISAYETAHGYSRGDTDGGAAANFPVNGVANGFGESQGRLRDLDQLTQEIRLSSNGDTKFKWQVGAMWFDQRDITEFDQRAFFLTTAARNPNNWVLLHDVNTSWGLFGQVLAPSMILDYYAGLGSTFSFDTVKDGPVNWACETKEVPAGSEP